MMRNDCETRKIIRKKCDNGNEETRGKEPKNYGDTSKKNNIVSVISFHMYERTVYKDF